MLNRMKNQVLGNVLQGNKSSILESTFSLAFPESFAQNQKLWSRSCCKATTFAHSIINHFSHLSVFQ